jgi:Tol biopolymer transport system component
MVWARQRLLAGGFMNRLSFVSGVLLPALVALLPACGGDSKCKGRDCDSCEGQCATGESCIDGACVPSCAAPSQTCGEACVDVQTSSAHCGSCDRACAAHGECTAGQCENPLALMQTRLLNSPEQGVASVEDRDLYMLEDGSYTLIKVNGPALAQGGVVDHSILPSGDVVMIAAQDSDGVNELYLVSPRGGARTKLNPPIADGGSVQDGLAVSGDGKRLLYKADLEADGVVDLYLVEVAKPGVAVKVSALPPTSSSVEQFVLSADGRRAAYTAYDPEQSVTDGYTVDLSGATPGPAQRLGEGGRDVYELQLSRDGGRIVYRAQDSGDRLFVSSASSPGDSTRLENADGGEGNVDSYHLSADGSAVVYVSSPFFNERSMWRAALAGNPPYESTELVDGETVGSVRDDLRVTADGAQVYFRKRDANTATGVNVEGVERLHRVDVARPGQLTLLSSDADSYEAAVVDFTLSRDGKSLAYRGNERVPVFTKQASKAVRAAGVRPMAEFPDDGRLALELRFVDLSQPTPAAPLLLTTEVTADHDGIMGGYLLTNDRRVLLRADYDQAYAAEVYLVTAGTPGVLRKVSPMIEQSSAAAEISVQSLF